MAQRLPYDQWLLTQTREQLIERDLKKKARAAAKPKSTGTISGRGAYYQKYPAGGRAKYSRKRTTVKGRGPYSIGGGIGVDWPSLGVRGNVGGQYYSSDYVAPMKEIPRVSGLGPYHVKQNSLMGAIDLGMDPPEVRNTNKGEATVFNHREYLGELISGSGAGNSAFTLQEYSLNPGNSNLFPFLAPIAHQFQEYEVRGMLVELKTMSSDISTTLAMGSMFMAANYNTLGPAPTNKQQLENMEYASSCKPSRSIIMPIECERTNSVNPHLYIADDLNYEGGDKRLFDLCNIYIGSQGVPIENADIAEIWITYEVALFKPVILDQVLPGNQAISAHLIGTSPASINPLGAVNEWVTGSDPRFTFVDNQVTFPSGIHARYLCTFAWVGATAVVGVLPNIATYGQLATVTDIWSDSTANHTTSTIYGFRTSAAVANNMNFSIVVEMLEGGDFAGGLVIGDAGTYPYTGGHCDLIITTISLAVLEGTPELPAPIMKQRKHRKTKKVITSSSESTDEESSYETVKIKKNKH